MQRVYGLAISDGTLFDMIDRDAQKDDKGRSSPAIQTVLHKAFLVVSLSVYSNNILETIKRKT